jgi:hypothetical protein
MVAVQRTPAMEDAKLFPPEGCLAFPDRPSDRYAGAE